MPLGSFKASCFGLLEKDFQDNRSKLVSGMNLLATFQLTGTKTLIKGVAYGLDYNTYPMELAEAPPLDNSSLIIYSARGGDQEKYL